jgi:hypothetical protein
MQQASSESVVAKSPKRLATAVKQPFARSRVGNGKALIAGLDHRSSDYREYQDIVADLAAHLGSDPSVVELAIAEEAGGLIFWCRRARAALLTGQEFNAPAYCTATNSLRRLLQDIGQERRLKDVTPSLEQYISARYGTQTSGSETGRAPAAARREGSAGSAPRSAGLSGDEGGWA